MGCEEVHTRGAASVLDGAALAPNSSEGCMHRRWTRRHVLAGIAGSAAAATAWRPASAESAGDTFKGPGMAMHGEPKYKPGFPHFAYVNPAAPKGGSLYTGVGDATFDSLNPFILQGTVASGIGTYVFDTLMHAAEDEPFSY
jgi:microcin C transport system substrate-binding protein